MKHLHMCASLGLDEGGERELLQEDVYRFLPTVALNTYRMHGHVIIIRSDY